MYTWIGFLNILCAFGFLSMQVLSASAWVRVRQAHNLERTRFLQRLSVTSMAAAYIFLGLLLLTGTIAGALRGWWSSGWIWPALALSIGIGLAMTALSRRYFARIRRGAWLETYEKRSRRPSRPQPVSR